MKEIEKKFKIASRFSGREHIDKAELEKVLTDKGVNITKYEIIQYYLPNTPDGMERRLRSVRQGTLLRYFITYKSAPESMKGVLSREEIERPISKDYFNRYLEEATSMLVKERWELADGISIDFIDLDKDNDIAIMEIEFPSTLHARLVEHDNVGFFLNDGVEGYPFTVLDVTDKEEYRSKNLSRKIK